MIAAALRSLGVDAGVGEVPGEYCPGAYSVHARGVVKLMGVGQRLTKHAAHVGGVIVVDHGHLVTQAIDPVYQALGLTWDPTTSGSVVSECSSATWDATVAALLQEFAKSYELEDSSIDDDLLQRARTLAPDHKPAYSGR